MFPAEHQRMTRMHLNQQSCCIICCTLQKSCPLHAARCGPCGAAEAAAGVVGAAGAAGAPLARGFKQPTQPDVDQMQLQPVFQAAAQQVQRSLQNHTVPALRVCECLVRMCMHTHAQYFGFLRENSSACFCAAVAITYLLYRLSFWICLAEKRGQISALCWLLKLSVDLPLWSPMVYNVKGSGRRTNLTVSTRADTLTCT